MMFWNRTTVCLRSTEIRAEQKLEKRSPGLLVGIIYIFKARLHTAHTDCVFFSLTKGTLLEQPSLYEEDVNSPEMLQRYFFSSFLLFTEAEI